MSAMYALSEQGPPKELAALTQPRTPARQTRGSVLPVKGLSLLTGVLLGFELRLHAVHVAPSLVHLGPERRANARDG
jgi:hypothetical protein